MTVTASSGSTRVTPQRYDTLPLSSVRQAEQQDRFPDGGELDGLNTFFLSGQLRLAAARSLSENAEFIVAKAANRIFAGGTPLSYLDNRIGIAPANQALPGALAADQAAFQKSVETFAQGTAAGGGGSRGGNLLSRLLEGASGDGDVRVVLPTGFTPIVVGRYGTDRMKKSIRDLAWFLRYVGYALVAGDPSILKVNTRGLCDVLEKACSLAATNVALQEMRAAAAGLLKDNPPARQLVIQYFNVLLGELAVPTPSARQRLGSKENQGLQLPATYALAAEGAQRFNMKPGMGGAQKAEVIRAAYRQVFERDIVKGYSQVVAPVEATQVRQGDISMREFIRALGRSNEYRRQFYGRFSNSRAVELAFRHFLGRGISSKEEFTRYFDIVSAQGLRGLVDSLINTGEYARVFGEETVPYLRDLGEEAQESAGWGSNRKLFRFSAPFEGAPQYVTLYASYRQPLPDQHVYGGGNDPLALNYGAIFPSGTASVATRPAPYGYDARRILIGNGLAQPGQMNSPQFRKASPRRVGPKVVRLQQISTGGGSVPRRGGQPSIRGTEASTQAVIRAVYNQVLGNTGYAGENSKVEEIKLENGDISLREFVRQVARSGAFRRRYWSGLYITKAIEVMHRRLIGRPTLGRWEINAYFDTAARNGFYGVVDAMVNSAEYNESFGEDTVPFERFITANDRNARQIPSFNRAFNASGYVEPAGQRPNVPPSQALRTVSGDLVPRNLAEPNRVILGGWSAQVAGGQVMAPTSQAVARGPGSVRQAPEPTRRWRPVAPRTPGSNSFTSFKQVGSPSLPPIGAAWRASVGDGRAMASVSQPDDAMARALKPGQPQGFGRRQSLGEPVILGRPASETDLQTALEASYKQLLNRVPFESERFGDMESQFRNNQLTVAELVGQLAGSELFQQRLNRMAPLRAASAAYLCLLGRAAQPKEVSLFLATRANAGQQAAVDALLNSDEYASAFGQNTVPYVRGMATAVGQPLSTVNRTASLYAGNAGLNPGTKAAI